MAERSCHGIVKCDREEIPFSDGKRTADQEVLLRVFFPTGSMFE